VVLLLKVNLAPVVDKFVHSFISVPLLSVNVTVTLSIFVVPEAPLIVKLQVALLPEKAKVKVCVLVEKGSITTNADALIDKHRIETAIAKSLKILFITQSSVILFEAYLSLCNKKRK
jgi:hypothetical protein